MTFKQHQEICCKDVGHWLACEAHHGFTDRQWNSKSKAASNEVLAAFWKVLFAAIKDGQVEIVAKS